MIIFVLETCANHDGPLGVYTSEALALKAAELMGESEPRITQCEVDRVYPEEGDPYILTSEHLPIQ